MKKSPEDAAARRQTVVQVGIAVSLFASIGLVTTACIFDKGDYQGGGRLPQAATAQQSSGGTSSSSSSGDDDDDQSSSSSSTSSSSSSGLVFLPDGGLAPGQ